MAVLRHIFLTGPPGVGKTTLIRRVLHRLGASVELAGFVTVEELGADGQRVGFRSVDLADASHTVQLATLEAAEKACVGHDALPQVGPFRVHVEDMVTFAARALVAPSAGTTPRGRRLVVLDEVGAMQLLSSTFQALLAEALGHEGGDGTTPCLGTLPSPGLHDLPFVEGIRERGDVHVFAVTEDNREDLVDEIWQLLQGFLHSPAVAAQVSAKMELAKRYVTELPVRLEGSISDDEVLHFRGDHGIYEIQRVTGTEARRCSCPFFREQGLCSHVLALVFSEEA